MEIPMIDQTTAPYGATLLRISLGAMWISHALLKFVVFTIPGLAAFLESKGLPAFAAWPLFLAELIGGTAILLGFYGRQVSVLLLPILIVAMLTHIPNGWVFTAPNGGWEYPAFLIAASLAHVLLGDGVHALASRPLVPALPLWRTA
jgi:putative oxidoreductase